MHELLFNEIFSYLSEKDKFSILQKVCREWRTVVWHPEFNQTVSLRLDESNTKHVQTQMYRKFEKHLNALLESTGAWSQLLRLSITGLTHTSPLLDYIAPIGSSVQSLQLIRPDPESVHSIVENAHQFKNLSKMCVSEVELEFLHEIDFLSFPLLTDLTLEEVFLVKDHSVLSLTPPSHEDDNFNGDIRETCKLVSLDLYILPFSELLNFLKTCLNRFFFPSLTYFRVRCLSASQHADQLATVIETKVPRRGWHSLESIEIGIVTDDLVEAISSRCDPATLHKIFFPSKIDISFNTTLSLFANRFCNVSDLSVRIKSSKQVEELAGVISNSPWRYSISSIKVSWSSINSISVIALVKLRLSLGRDFEQQAFKASSRMVSATLRCTYSKEDDDPFKRFFHELCRDRIVCECEECASSSNIEHISALAEEEWESELPKKLRDQLIQLYL